MPKKLAYLSGAPRVSTKSCAEATGARQHVLGTLQGFRANGWEVHPYIVGDKVPEDWIRPGSQAAMANSFMKRLMADAMRLLLGARHTGRALREIGPVEWVYERYGALQLFGWFFQWRGAKWILETNNPFFLEATSDRKSVALPVLVRWLERFAYHKCNVLVVVSDALKALLVERLGIPADKILVLPNAADTEFFDPETASPVRLFGPETFIIGWQGNMYAWAGLELLLRAVHRLRGAGLDIGVVLLGDGMERRRLEALAVELNLGPSIKFPGRVPRADVPGHIAGFDLCYSGQIPLTSGTMYHSPLKLYDYMAMGKPVLAARFADAKKLLQGQPLGYLFRTNDLDDLTRTIHLAWDERAGLAAMGEAARVEILAGHTWPVRVRTLLDQVGRQLEQKASPPASAGHSPLARNFARALESSPRLRAHLRDGYHALSYLRHRERGFAFQLAEGAKMVSAAEWAGVTPHTSPAFFGYYDKSPFSPDGTMLLMHEANAAAGSVSVVIYDRANKCRIPLGATYCWTWQQGAQATWLPGLGTHTAGYNSWQDDQLGLMVVDAGAGTQRFVPYQIQALLPDGRTMLSLNYPRLATATPDYGYPVEMANFPPELAPEKDGVWTFDLRGETAKLVLSLAQLMDLKPLGSMAGAVHYVNHCAPSPDGTRFLVLHRWRLASGRTLSRLILMPLDGGAPRIMLDKGKVSHYAWRSAAQFVVWGRSREHGDRYHLMNADSGDYVAFGAGVADVHGDGHPTFSRLDPGRMLTDSYPDRKRQQHLFMYDDRAHKRTEIGCFLSPLACRDAERCDLHPRFNADETLISIDSSHTGTRQSYVITRA